MLTETKTATTVAHMLADFAQKSLLEELYLTPKPGLVDMANNGSHHDLNVSVMESSAFALRRAFYRMAEAALQREPSQLLREELGAIGRDGEQQMLAATGGINAHKGAIWSIGLLVAASTILLSRATAFDTNDILATAGEIARYNDRYMPSNLSNGQRVSNSYQVRTAREEAALGFPSLVQTAFPAWHAYRNEVEEVRRLNVLLALISVVDDTCILHRRDMRVLEEIRQKAKQILHLGGLGLKSNQVLYQDLEEAVKFWWVSPGGSADLLAATIFIHKVSHHFNHK